MGVLDLAFSPFSQVLIRKKCTMVACTHTATTDDVSWCY
jgi:hypothetical protein